MSIDVETWRPRLIRAISNLRLSTCLRTGPAVRAYIDETSGASLRAIAALLIPLHRRSRLACILCSTHTPALRCPPTPGFSTRTHSMALCTVKYNVKTGLRMYVGTYYVRLACSCAPHSLMVSANDPQGSQELRSLRDKTE